MYKTDVFYKPTNLIVSRLFCVVKSNTSDLFARLKRLKSFTQHKRKQNFYCVGQNIR